MKFPLLAMALAALAFGQARTVYLLPMGNGLDQYLANHLTKSGAMQVVADPKAASLVLTDRLGEPLERRLAEIDPEPKPEAAKPEAAKPEASKKDETAEDGSGGIAAAMAEGGSAQRPSTFSRARGTIFLVDVKSRHVVWSAWELPKDTTPASLDRTAARLAGRMQKDLSPKPEKK